MEVMETKRKTDTRSPIAMLLIGILLLIPLVYFAGQTHVQPALQVFQTAQTDGNLLSEPEFIGQENFTRLQEDERFGASLSFNLSLALSRVGVVLFVPVIIGILAGVQKTIGRYLNRLVLAALTGFIAPIALILLWFLYWGQLWGTEPSPVFTESLLANTPETARNSVQLLDALITFGIAVVVGVTGYMAVMRSSRKWLAGFAVWLVGLIIAFASGFLVFEVPFILTRGGPANATSTLMLNIFDRGFTQFRIGYASAQASYIVLGALVVGLLIWLIVTLLQVRIVYAAPDDSGSRSSLLSVLSIPLMLLVAYPIVGLVLWGRWLAIEYEGYGQLAEAVDFAQAQANAQSPWSVIWLIHLPITYLAALSLGFIRPLGKIGSNVLFLLLFAVTLIPLEGLIFEWFTLARDNGVLNSPEALHTPWLVNGFSLLFLKLFFDGAREKYHAARMNGQSARDAFIRTVLVPSLMIAILIGVVLSFISSQSLTWALVTQNSREAWTTPVAITTIMGQFAFENSMLGAAVTTMVTSLIIPFVIAFAILHIVVLDRLVILAGRDNPAKMKVTE